jgi:hypothetical protein
MSWILRDEMLSRAMHVMVVTCISHGADLPGFGRPLADLKIYRVIDGHHLHFDHKSIPHRLGSKLVWIILPHCKTTFLTSIHRSEVLHRAVPICSHCFEVQLHTLLHVVSEPFNDPGGNVLRNDIYLTGQGYRAQLHL